MEVGCKLLHWGRKPFFRRHLLGRLGPDMWTPHCPFKVGSPPARPPALQPMPGVSGTRASRRTFCGQYRASIV